MRIILGSVDPTTEYDGKIFFELSQKEGRVEITKIISPGPPGLVYPHSYLSVGLQKLESLFKIRDYGFFVFCTSGKKLKQRPTFSIYTRSRCFFSVYGTRFFLHFFLFILGILHDVAFSSFW